MALAAEVQYLNLLTLYEGGQTHYEYVPFLKGGYGYIL